MIIHPYGGMRISIGTRRVFYVVVFLVVESDRVRGTHRAGPHPVGFRLANKLRLVRIERQVSLQLLADVGRQADVHGPNHDLGTRHCGSARADAIEEIRHAIQRPLGPGHVLCQPFRVFAHQHRR